MPNITILTPTYNRADRLPHLYTSLLKQHNTDFIWMIIDDGSTDNTEKLAADWKAENKINIEYHQKPNGGKHTALNYAYPFLKTPLTFIVDSDDYLTSDAIEKINAKYVLYKEESDLCAFSFLRGKPDGGYLSTGGVPYDNLKESYCECRLNRNIGGDMAEVWFTHCLKEFPFPEYEGEKFIGEDLIWVRMSKQYKMRFYNDVIYISDYLDDGLTNNRRKHNIASPKGCVERAEEFLSADIHLKLKIKSILQYQIYSAFAGIPKKEQFRKSDHKLLYLVTFPFAEMLYIKWKREYKN